MNFRFDIGKATEAACTFLAASGGQINIMKLVKLCYLADRVSLDRRGIPVMGGDYLSMRNGPVISEVLDLINSGSLAGEKDRRWEECVSDRQDHVIELTKSPEREDLSDSDLQLLESVWTTFGGFDQWQLRDWCHANCGEWTDVKQGRLPIWVEQIAMALGKNAEQIQAIREDAAASNLLGEVFS